MIQEFTCPVSGLAFIPIDDSPESIEATEKCQREYTAKLKQKLGHSIQDNREENQNGKNHI